MGKSFVFVKDINNIKKTNKIVSILKDCNIIDSKYEVDSFEKENGFPNFIEQMDKIPNLSFDIFKNLFDNINLSGLKILISVSKEDYFQILDSTTNLNSHSFMLCSDYVKNVPHLISEGLCDPNDFLSEHKIVDQRSYDNFIQDIYGDYSFAFIASK